jgi:hypothetical protein
VTMIIGVDQGLDEGVKKINVKVVVFGNESNLEL